VQPAAELLAEIKQTIADQPSYGYRRVHALIRLCRREQRGRQSTSSASKGS
jgi:hypothetical protein